MNATTKAMLVRLVNVGGECPRSGKGCVTNVTGRREAEANGWIEDVSTGRPGVIQYSRTYKVQTDDLQVTRITDAGRAALTA